MLVTPELDCPRLLVSERITWGIHAQIIGFSVGTEAAIRPQLISTLQEVSDR